MGDHINADGRFQSDKYPTCPAGKVPLSTRDTTAQDLLWQYAQRRRPVDPEFSDDLETCLRNDGYKTADDAESGAALYGQMACYLVSRGWKVEADKFWLDPHPELIECKTSSQDIHRAVERQFARDFNQPDPFSRFPKIRVT